MASNAVVRGATSACVSENIELIRKGRGMSQAQLANQMTKVGRPMLDTAVSKMERGTRRIDVDDLVALAAAFGIRPEQLLVPWKCETCNGEPPRGFTCQGCGARGETA